METRAKPAGKPANADFGVFYFHCNAFSRVSPGIPIIMDTGMADSKYYSLKKAVSIFIGERDPRKSQMHCQL
jgi:hypothetical protein